MLIWSRNRAPDMIANILFARCQININCVVCVYIKKNMLDTLVFLNLPLPYGFTLILVYSYEVAQNPAFWARIGYCIVMCVKQIGQHTE